MFPKICERYKISEDINEVPHSRCEKSYRARGGSLVFTEKADRELKDCPFDECPYKFGDLIPEQAYVSLHQLPVR